ncbi:hypothetical protein [Lacrimispora sp. 38-1]|uniref:hypothetical protein n=1 Tax=Lacrimispora sp. 38-1 TaxID=3125778 RepID=UPI003CF4C18F
MVAIVRLDGFENWHICDIFLEKQPEDEQEAIAIQTAIRCNEKSLYFSDLPNKAFYRLIGIYVPPLVLKVTQGQYFTTHGKMKVVYRSCFTRSLARPSTLWFMMKRMDINEAIYLLEEVNIHIIDDGNAIYHDISFGENFPLENYYAIRLNEQDKWEYCFVQKERRNVPEYKTVKVFKNKEDALKYFYLDRLRDYFMQNFIQKRIDFNENWNIDFLLLLIEKHEIPKDYFSYGFIENRNSILYYNEKEKHYNAFIGSNGDTVCTSPELENEKTALISTFKRINLLYFLDKFIEEKQKELEKYFTDTDRGEFLSYKF